MAPRSPLRPSAAKLAWSLWALATAAFAASVAVSVLNWDERKGDLLFLVLFGALAMSICTVGALVASRRPANPIGWVLTVGPLPLTLSGLADEYGFYGAFSDPGAVPGPVLAKAIGLVGFLPALLAIPTLLLLLFPDGRIGRRWRPALWLSAAGNATMALALLLRPGQIEADNFVADNPIGIPGTRSLFDALFLAGLVAAALAVPLAAAAMISRLRRSRGLERQQLKWIASASALFAFSCVGALAAILATGDSSLGVAVVLTFPLIPIAAGYAILRHRLYDVGLVVNRALVYGSLTAVLAGAYVGLVLLLGLALSPLTEQSDLAIAVSTLAVAALFQPVRRRMRRLVDRRFYRHKYDASRTLEGFSSRLQAQTDLEALRADLAEVVNEAMQPAHVSVWLRGSGR